ncbi:MAG: hypothetical protein AAGE52_06740 [Myxococcota bacterium]
MTCHGRDAEERDYRMPATLPLDPERLPQTETARWMQAYATPTADRLMQVGARVPTRTSRIQTTARAL